MKDTCPSCDKGNHEHCWGYRPRRNCFNAGFECTCQETACQKFVKDLKELKDSHSTRGIHDRIFK